MFTTGSYKKNYQTLDIFYVLYTNSERFKMESLIQTFLSWTVFVLTKLDISWIFSLKRFFWDTLYIIPA